MEWVAQKSTSFLTAKVYDLLVLKVRPVDTRCEALWSMSGKKNKIRCVRNAILQNHSRGWGQAIFGWRVGHVGRRTY